jgi:DNA repair protein SbcD/Mre11
LNAHAAILWALLSKYCPGTLVASCYLLPLTLRVLHTSDWHLGHTLHDVSREYEHQCFFSWLLDTLDQEQIDALIIAGDIFDVANPSASAQQQWYRFLSQARAKFPELDIVAIAGNHDSAARLEAPHALLEAQNIQVLGWLPRTEEGEIDLGRLLVPLHDAAGEVAALCAAVPFLRPADLPRCPDADDNLIDGVRQIYLQAINGAIERATDGQAILATGHCYMSSSRISDLSERKILGGNEHALPADLFSKEVDYVALGHLHLAQEIGERQGLRYSGSPIPLSMSEVDYPHQVCVVTFEGKEIVSLKTPRVPRAVELLRIPKDCAKEKSEVLRELEALPDASEASDDSSTVDGPAAQEGDRPPLLEVRIRLERPESTLRSEVTEILQGKHVRLVKLTVETTGSGKALSETVEQKQLQDIQPDDVFRQLYASQHEGDPPADLMACFHEVVEAAEHGEAS